MNRLLDLVVDGVPANRLCILFFAKRGGMTTRGKLSILDYTCVTVRQAGAGPRTRVTRESRCGSVKQERIFGPRCEGICEFTIINAAHLEALVEGFLEAFVRLRVGVRVMTHGLHAGVMRARRVGLLRLLLVDEQLPASLTLMRRGNNNSFMSATQHPV